MLVFARSLADPSHHGPRTVVHVDAVERLPQRVGHKDTTVRKLYCGMHIAEVIGKDRVRWAERFGLYVSVLARAHGT